MTQSESLTLEQLAAAANMTARNVRAYQTRGLLQPPRREGRASVYGAEHVERLLQVQRARSRGASLRLLRTLIAEGRELDGVWEPQPPGSVERPAQRPAERPTQRPAERPAQRPAERPTQRPVGREGVVDVSDAAQAALHTADCLARRRLPLAPLLAVWGQDMRDVAGARLPGQVPGSFACAVTALDAAGVMAPSTAVRLAATLVQAAQAVADVTTAAVDAGGVDDGRRAAVAARIGELAGALVEQLVTTSAVPR